MRRVNCFYGYSSLIALIKNMHTIHDAYMEEA